MPGWPGFVQAIFMNAVNKGEAMRYFVVGWYSKATDASGQGTTALNESVCDAICSDANKEHPELEHFSVDLRTGDVPSWNRNSPRKVAST